MVIIRSLVPGKKAEAPAKVAFKEPKQRSGRTLEWLGLNEKGRIKTVS